MRIDAYSGIGDTMLPLPNSAVSGGQGFDDLLRNAVAQVNQDQLNSENIVERVAAGEDIDDAVVVTAVTKAELAFTLMVQIRNKLTDAFDELRQLQV